MADILASTSMIREELVAFAGEQLISAIDDLLSMVSNGEDISNVEITHTIRVQGQPFTLHLHHGHCDAADDIPPVTIQ